MTLNSVWICALLRFKFRCGFTAANASSTLSVVEPGIMIANAANSS